MSGRLQDKVAIITGGSGGIGASTATLFHQEGAKAAIVDLEPEDVEQAARDIGPNCLGITADIARESDAERAIRTVHEQLGRIDILVNAAAIRLYGPVTDATQESWEHILGINLVGTASMCKFAIPHMSEAGGGSIVNIATSNASAGRSGMVQYDASKGAMLSMTRAMACDHAHASIRVNALSPGPTLTPFHIRRRMADTGETYDVAEAELRSEGAPKTLMGRQAEPVEVARGILFLASDDASFITGINLPVDGGLFGLRT